MPLLWGLGYPVSFGQEDELTENKGLVHEYLGIIIDYPIPRKVVFTMFDYLEDVIVEAS